MMPKPGSWYQLALGLQSRLALTEKAWAIACHEKD